MRADCRGDAGFMEAMVAFMAVAIVLTAFMGALASTTVETSDPTDSLDAGRFTGTMEDGVFVPGYTEYLEGFLDSRGFEGATVLVGIPGGFCGEVAPDIFGSMDGLLFSRMIQGTVTDGAGRVVPAVFEVILCV